MSVNALIAFNHQQMDLSTFVALHLKMIQVLPQTLVLWALATGLGELAKLTPTGEVVIQGVLEEGEEVVGQLEGLLMLRAGVVGVLLVLVVGAIRTAEVLLVLMLTRLDVLVIIAKLEVCQSLMVLGINKSLQVYSLITTGHLDYRLRLIEIVLPLNSFAVSL